MDSQDNEQDMTMQRRSSGLNSQDVHPPATLLPNVLARLGLLHTLPAPDQAVVLQDKTSWQAQAQAVQALGDLGRQAPFERIVANLQAPHEAVRMAALRALGNLKQHLPVPMKYFTDALQDAHREVRATAVHMLASFGEQAPLEFLLSALEDDEALVRVAAIQALGALNAQTAIPQLQTALQDTEWQVREAAVRALGMLGEHISSEALVAALYDPHRFVREAAIFALGDQVSLAIQTLIRDLRSGDISQRAAAIRALGELRERAPLNPLINALHDGHPTVRLAAVLALGHLKSPEAVQALRHASSQDRDESIRDTARLVLESQEPEAHIELTKLEPETVQDAHPVIPAFISSTRTSLRDTNYEGWRFGDYVLERALGSGSKATVYLGHHVFHHTSAAIKVFWADLEEKGMESFRSRAQTLAQLTHPHIVRILDADIAGETPFLVMDYTPRGTLRQRHRKGEHIPLPTVVSYTKQVAEALQYAHEHGVIHLDVKPENMLIGPNDEILLSDFGIEALAIYSKQPYPYEYRVASRTDYVAPERSKHEIRQASDQYSLGVVVYEWLCGETPFSEYPPGVIAQRQYNLPPALREKVPQLPRAVEDVVMKALATQPEDRYGSVQAFAQALEEVAVTGQSSTRTFQIAASLASKPRSSRVAQIADLLLHNFRAGIRALMRWIRSLYKQKG